MVKPYPRNPVSRLLFVVSTIGLLSLLTLVAMVMSPESLLAQVGRWCLGDDDKDRDDLCRPARELRDGQPDIKNLTVTQLPTQATKPIMIRHPKGKDLDPKPFEYTQLAHEAANLARRPPQSLLLGFAKCGTSALLEFLNLHPNIVTLDWEPDYFCDRMYPKYDLQWYVKRMPPSKLGQVTVEKSPCYIVEHDSHVRMKAMNGSLKLMVLIRNPIVRLLSEYGHYSATERYWGRTPTAFVDRITDQRNGRLRSGQLLKVGNYLEHFHHLLQVFPREQILVLDGDKLITDPLVEIAKVESFLGLEHQITSRDIYFDEEKGFYCMFLNSSGEKKCLGKSKGRDHEHLDDTLRKKLEEFFMPYNEKLFALLGQEFDW